MNATTTGRESAAARRSRRRRDAVLAGELAGYSSAAERLELDAMMARYSDEDTAELRRVLAGIHA